MNKIIKGLLLCLVISLSSCGISNELRGSSQKLVKLNSQIDSSQFEFHKTVISSLEAFLAAEKKKSENTYKKTVSLQEDAFRLKVQRIFKSEKESMDEKMVKFLNAQGDRDKNIDKASSNRILRTSLIEQALSNLNESSDLLIKAEMKQGESIRAINAYLQEKRPLEEVQDQLNLNFEFVKDYMGQANSLIAKTKPIINILNP
jgi:esterase/lipase